MRELLFNRDFALTVGTVRIAARPLAIRPDGATSARPTLRVQFKVERQHGVLEPNSAEIVIYNLSESSRKAIQVKDTHVKIEAGYLGNMSQIFQGNLTFANHTRNGVDWLTKFQLADGGLEFQNSRINESFAPGHGAGDALLKIIKTTNLGIGNVDRKVREGNFRGAITEFTKGFSASGQTFTVLQNLLNSYGLEGSIQDGQIQISRDGEVTGGPTTVLRPTTGLIGSPEIGEEKKTKGIVKLRSLLQPSVVPGRRIQVFSRVFDGAYFRAERVTHIGDSWGADWYTDIEATAIAG